MNAAEVTSSVFARALLCRKKKFLRKRATRLGEHKLEKGKVIRRTASQRMSKLSIVNDDLNEHQALIHQTIEDGKSAQLLAEEETKQAGCAVVFSSCSWLIW
jgi:hypothetical protein